MLIGLAQNVTLLIGMKWPNIPYSCQC